MGQAQYVRLSDRMEEAKSKYDIVTYVQEDLRTGRQRGRRVWFNCPFHAEKTPSFAVDFDKQRWRCYGACNTSGDIFDYIGKRHGCEDDRERQLEILTGVQAPNWQEIMKLRESNQEEEETELDMDSVRKWHQWFDVAVPYFTKRAVNEQVGRTHLLGTVIEREYFPVWVNGIPYKHSCKRYVIPHVTAGTLRNWNMRRDDAEVMAKFNKVDSRVILQVIENIVKKSAGKLSHKDVTDDMIIDRLFGRKYLQAKGNKPGIYNADLLIDFDEEGKPRRDKSGNVMMRRLPYVLVVEGEITCLSLISAGYPAVAAKFVHGIDFKAAFSGVYTPIFVAENDDNEAGLNYARMMYDAVQRGKIIHTLRGYNDPNDVAVASKLDKWLYPYGIEPMLDSLVAF